MKSTRFDAQRKIWHGPETDSSIDKTKQFGELILESLGDQDSNRIAQINCDTGETLTKAEIRIRTIRCAQNLTKLGCTQDDCIAIVARNHNNLTPLLFAAVCIGAPISPLDVVIVTDGISAILRRVNPLFIFCDADAIESTRKIATDIGLNAKFFTVNGSFEGVDSIDVLMNETGQEDSFVCTQIKDSEKHIAVIGCSSGSTGLPKSICLSHALLRNVLLNSSKPLTIICFSSLYWLSGLLTTLLSTKNSVRLFTTKPFSADLFYDFVAKYKPQFFIGPPCQVQEFLKSDRCTSEALSPLLVCMSIGGPVPSVLVQTMKTVIPECIFMTGYGITEVGGGISGTMPGELELYPGTSGFLSRGVSVKIISEQTGELCGIKEEGEIYALPAVPSLGYYKDEEANRNSFDSDGFFITGDLGYFDETGRLFIIGRKKEIFKNRGFAVWPAELEDLIIKNPAIKGVSVVNVYDEDLMSDLPAAVVVKKEGFSITEQEVYDIIAGQLAQYKRLDGGVYFVDELPMTPSDKIVRAKVKDMAQKFYQLKKQK